LPFGEGEAVAGRDKEAGRRLKVGIGRKVDGKELQDLLEKEAQYNELVKKIRDEISALRVGECLAYETENMLATDIALSSLVTTIKGKFRVVSGVRDKYVYREK